MKPLSNKQIQKRIAKGKNFSEAYLKYTHFRESNLFKANFFRADLEGADFEGADLVRSHFLEANLEGSNLIDANLSEAYLEDANLYRADLEDCDLRKADLKGANLRDAHFKNATLEKADLEGAQAASANFTKVNFSGADLTNINLSYAKCQDANFYKSTLVGALLKNGDFRDCNFCQANLENADLENADLRGAHFEGAHLSGVMLDGCKVNDSRLKRGNFPEISARWIDFSYFGDGSERVDFETREFQLLMESGLSLMIDVSGLLNVESLVGLSRFLAVMETLLPHLTVSIDSISTTLNRTRMLFSLAHSKEASVYSFCLFLIYQFGNSKSIECSVLEDSILKVQSPIFSGLLLKRRPLSPEIIKKILEVKKLLKAEIPFFKGNIYRFTLTKSDGKIIIMLPSKDRGRDSFRYYLTFEKETI